MKKYLIAFLLSFSFFRIGSAAITDPLVIQEKSVAVHFSTTVPVNITTTTPSVFSLITLSTTTGVFPHMDRGEIDISYLNITVDRVATSSGIVKVGVVNFVSGSTGSVTFFNTKSFLKNVSNTDYTGYPNLDQEFYRCKVKSNRSGTVSDVDGSTPFILSNDTRSASTLYRSSVSIPSPIGVATPGVGDIVMEVANGDVANTVNVIIDIIYHSEP